MCNNMEKYNKKIIKFTKMSNEKDIDLLEIHILRDKIFMNFIKDISSNKISSDEILLISKEINNKIIKKKINKNMWYA